jgi:D-3-phosphoglycerate dehydrogenase / 2-oxoglutarate reductase
MTQKILTTTSSFGKSDSSPIRQLESAGFSVIANPHGKTLNEAEALAFFHEHRPVGIIAGLEPLNANVLTQCADFLKVVSRCGTGLDNVDLDAAKKIGINVLNTPEAPAEAVAELTLGFILALLRNIPAHDRSVHAGEWTKRMGYLLSETTIGIIGLGRIGKRVAAFLEKLGPTILAADCSPDHAWISAHQVTLVSPDEILPASDVITLHLPSSSGELHHFMNRNRLRKMKPGSFLINTSRGALIDEAALCESLDEGPLAGAALDVFEQEPYAGPLLRYQNVILSPHSGSYAKATRTRMEMEAATNLLNALRENT